MKSPIALLSRLLNDFSRLNPGVKGLDRDIITIEKRFEDEGYGFLTVALPALGRALQKALSCGKFTCPPGFRTTRGGSIPLLFSGMTCKVFDPLTGHLEDGADLCTLTDLYQVLFIFKKTQLSPKDEELLHLKAVNEFYQCDGTASRVFIPDRHDHHIGRVCKMLLNTLLSKDIENAKYKHGPGAVKEGWTANQKWQAVEAAVRDDPDFASRYGLENTKEISEFRDLFSSRQRPGMAADGRLLPERRGSTDNAEDLRNEGPRRRSVPPNSKRIRHVLARGRLASFDRASRSSAKLISVPKSSTSRRTITVEPALNQFIQQGLNILLRESISECRVLRNCIALSDQTLNQKLALEGSQTDGWATSKLRSGLPGPVRKLGLAVHNVAGTALGGPHSAATPARFQRWKAIGPLQYWATKLSQLSPDRNSVQARNGSPTRSERVEARVYIINNYVSS
jgi:hypothetical protein